MAKSNNAFLNFFSGRKLIIGVPYIWFIMLAAIPLLIVLKISLSTMETASVSNMIDWSKGWPSLTLNFESYQFILKDTLYIKT